MKIPYITAEVLCGRYYLDQSRKLIHKLSQNEVDRDYIKIDGINFYTEEIKYFLEHPEQLPLAAPKQKYTAEILSQWYYADKGKLWGKEFNEHITKPVLQPIKGKGYGTIGLNKAITLLELYKTEAAESTLENLLKRVERLEAIVAKYDLGA